MSWKNAWDCHRSIMLTLTACILTLSCLLFTVHFLAPDFDKNVANILRQDRGSVFDALMKFISAWGESYMMVVSVISAAFLFLVNGFKKEAWFSLSVFLADIVNIGLKILFNRPRPEAMDVFPSFQQASFPSGHVVHYAVFFGFVLAVMIVNQRMPYFYRMSIGALCLFLILGVSVSRVYLGTHWVTDILAAYLIGLALLTAILTAYFKRRSS